MLNLDLNNRKLPSLFEADGKIANSKADWESFMRPHWKKVLLDNVFGVLPPYVEPKISVVKDRPNFGGKAVWENVAFTFDYNGRSHTVPTRLILPKNVQNVPVFIYVDFDPYSPSKNLPVEEILDGGFGVFAVCYNDVTTDNGDFTNGIAGLFASEERKPNEAGKITYWAYMAMRMMDYLQSREEVDKSAIGISGHSRLGKTALLAAALDERFAFTCPNESGCSGVALSRGCAEKAEKISDIYTRFPYWFCPNYAKFIDDPYTLPLDHHCMVALVAPRAVYVGAAEDDRWADTNGQYMACVAASPAWKLYGKSGFVNPNRFPVVGDVFNEGEVGYHLRAGAHSHVRLDWQVYMASVKKYLRFRNA